MDLEQT